MAVSVIYSKQGHRIDGQYFTWDTSWVQPNDLVFLFMASDIGYPNTPSGWSWIWNYGSDLRVGVVFKRGNQISTPSETIDLNAITTSDVNVILVALRGADTSWFPSAAVSDGATGLPNGLSVTPQNIGSLAVLYGALDDDATTFTAPAGMTIVQQRTGSYGGGITSAAVAIRQFNDLNAFDPAAFTGSGTDVWQAWHFAVPAAPPIVNVTIPADPSTASADSVDITLATEINNDVLVSTGIVIDAVLVYPQVAADGSNIIPATPLTADADVVNNVIVDASTSNSVSAQEMTALAELDEPFIAEQPMTASANSGNNTVYVDPNYFSLVRSKNPLFYYNFDNSSMANFGSWSTTYEVGPGVQEELASGGSMGVVGEGQSWKFASSASSNDNYINIIPANPQATIRDLVLSRNFTSEFWVKPVNVGSSSYMSDFVMRMGPLTVSILGATSYALGGDMVANAYISTLTSGNYGLRSSGGSQLTSTYWTSAFTSTGIDEFPQTSLLAKNNWNHIVLKASPVDGTSNGVSIQMFINSTLFASSPTLYLDVTGITNASANYNKISFDDTFDLNSHGSLFDEIAIYGNALTNSQIIDNYSFINNLSPDATYYPQALLATAISGDNSYTVTSNAIPEIKEATASAVITEPFVQGGISIEIIAEPILASGVVVNPAVYYGINFASSPLTSYAESANAFALNTTYFDYVMANINPYRYVSFDGTNSLLDYGTDADYAVPATTIGGQIVSPQFGINGLSVKTAGVNYATDGVILNESEYNDNWGTGQSTYHSSFWVKRAPDDASTTGLRVLWNLNGYYDNQHVIVYQYQDRIRINFNNGSGTHLEFISDNDIDLFDGNEHFVAIGFDHTNNNNNIVNLYIDGLLQMTVNIGSYTGQTINSPTYLSPNDPAHNYPRLGIGCLITPFANTALPVIPTNTKLYIDEIVWAKSAMTALIAAAQYNAMPEKSDTVNAVMPNTATATIVEPVVTSGSTILSTTLTAEIQHVNSTVLAEFEIVNSVDIIDVQAEMLGAIRSDTVIIAADIFVATAIFNDHGVLITFSGPTMYASAKLAFEGITIDTDLLTVPVNIYEPLSKWVTYLRATEFDTIFANSEVM